MKRIVPYVSNAFFIVIGFALITVISDLHSESFMQNLFDREDRTRHLRIQKINECFKYTWDELETNGHPVTTRPSLEVNEEEDSK